MVLADAGEGKPSPATPVRAYVAMTFGKRLKEVEAAMRALAASLGAEELNPVGFQLDERFRPEVPVDVRGWDAKGELNLQKIRMAAGA